MDQTNISPSNETAITKVEKRSFRVMSILFYVTFVVVLAFILNTFVCQRVIVDGSSMNPTLKNKDNLIVEKLSKKSSIDRYSIVVFKTHEDGHSRNLIKRVIGLPGETIQIKNGNIFIDGKKLKGDKYGLEKIDNAGNIDVPRKLTKDEYFCVGDNRNNSYDSRWLGAINKDDIEGRVVVRMWPKAEFLY